MVTSRFLAAAYQGLMALTAQENLMSGRMSALWQTLVMVAMSLSGVGRRLCGGAFDLFADVPAGGGVDAHDRPAGRVEAAAGLRERISTTAGARHNLIGDIKRLVRHRAVYAPVLIMLLFQFSPGQNTPMQFYLANTLHAPAAVYGEFNGIISVSFIPAFFGTLIFAEVLAADASLGRRDRHGATDGPAGIGALRRPGSDVGRADRAAGRYRGWRILRSDDALMPARAAGKPDDAGRRRPLQSEVINNIVDEGDIFVQASMLL